MDKFTKALELLDDVIKAETYKDLKHQLETKETGQNWTVYNLGLVRELLVELHEDAKKGVH